MACWFAIHTPTGSEIKAAEIISERLKNIRGSFKIFNPIQNHYLQKNKSVQKIRKCPGYIFLKHENYRECYAEIYYAISNTRILDTSSGNEMACRLIGYATDQEIKHLKKVCNAVKEFSFSENEFDWTLWLAKIQQQFRDVLIEQKKSYIAFCLPCQKAVKMMQDINNFLNTSFKKLPKKFEEFLSSVQLAL